MSEWILNSESLEHAKLLRPGDYVTLREDASDVYWADDFFKKAGRGPYLVLDVNRPGESSATLHLANISGKSLYKDPSNRGSWIFAHFFVRNNFLGACHKAITCNPSPSEP